MRFACLLFALVTCGYSQSFPLESIEGLKPVRLNAEAGNFKGKKAVKVTEPPDAKGEDRYVLLPVPDFQDGTIEAEMTGRPASGAMEGARGFVGIAFRVVPDSASKFEMFYLRPTNGLLSNRPGHDAQSREPEWPRPPGKGFRALRFCPADWIGTSHTRLRVQTPYVRRIVVALGRAARIMAPASTFSAAWACSILRRGCSKRRVLE
jgi:hypothetical protein